MRFAISEAYCGEANLVAVRTLLGDTGQVLDADAAIKYPVVLSDGQWHEALFDRQILVEGADLGSLGDSGMLLVIDEDIAGKPFKAGEGLGLYIAIVAAGDFHFVSPLHACLKAIGAKEIHIP